MNRILNKIKQNKGLLISFAFSLFMIFMILIAFVPTKNSTIGRYILIIDNKLKEELVLHINNTAEYYTYDDNGNKYQPYDGRIKKWRMIYNNTQFIEYSEKGYIASKYQIVLTDEDWSTFFQVFKINNETLFSKITNDEETQKCYKKQ